VANEKGIAKLAPDHPEPEIGQLLLMGALGTTDPCFLNGLLGQLANVDTQGRDVDERGINFLLAVVKGVEPRDQVEAMLAAQMAAVHNATMTFARRLAHVDNPSRFIKRLFRLNRRDKLTEGYVDVVG
jgi:hypothetical protein